MHPRISGLGATPGGLICAAMPAVGLFHAGDPDYAYLDGVELASVAQGRMGADWAALSAAMIAACCTGDATAAVDGGPQDRPPALPGALLPDQPLRCKAARLAEGQAGGGLRRLVAGRGAAPLQQGRPLAGVEPAALRPCPLLERFGADAPKLLPLSLAATGSNFGVRSILAAAAAGALGGPETFPEEWLPLGRDHRAPVAAPRRPGTAAP